MDCVSSKVPPGSYHPFIGVIPHNKFQMSDNGCIWNYINNCACISEAREMRVWQVLHVLCRHSSRRAHE